MTDHLVQQQAAYQHLKDNLKPYVLRPETRRETFIGFGTDSAAVDAVRAALASCLPLGVDMRRATFRKSLEILAAMPTPETILVDLSDEDQPLTAIMDLEAVVDPGTTVLALGERRDVGFYRSLTRNFGVKEYLPKPLSAEIIARDFVPWILREVPKPLVARGGTVITVRGTCGGIGASTIAANLAWTFGSKLRRHTIVLDTDLYTGSIALLLNSAASPGLRTTLEAPDRIDPLLVERAAQPVSERLHVLAAEEIFSEKFKYLRGAAAALDATLRQRYNFIIVDTPLRPTAFCQEVQHLADHNLIVLSPTAKGIERAKAISSADPLMGGSRNTAFIVSYVNCSDRWEKLNLEKELGHTPILAVPDAAKQARRSENFGEPLVAKDRRFRKQIEALTKFVGLPPEGR